MKAAMAPSHEDKPAVLLSSEPEDLFPHLDSLAPSDLTIWQAFRESTRILARHFNSFLLPILLLTLNLVPTFGFCVMLFGFSMGEAMTLRSPPLWQFGLDFVEQCTIPGPALVVTVLYATHLVLTSLAEAAFHRAVVGAYLKERYITDGAAARNISGFMLAALRCAWSSYVALLLFVVVCALAGVMSFLLHGSEAGDNLALSAGLVVLLFLWAFFIVAFPVSASTTASGFRALNGSFLLTRDHFKTYFGLHLTFFLLISLLVLVPFGVTLRNVRMTPSIAFLFLGCALVSLSLCIIWAPFRTVLYLRLRASHTADRSKSMNWRWTRTPQSLESLMEMQLTSSLVTSL